MNFFFREFINEQNNIIDQTLDKAYTEIVYLHTFFLKLKHKIYEIITF